MEGGELKVVEDGEASLEGLVELMDALVDVVDERQKLLTAGFPFLVNDFIGTLGRGGEEGMEHFVSHGSDHFPEATQFHFFLELLFSFLDSFLKFLLGYFLHEELDP